ncbi:MAG: 23S rRNA (pseudouridine(1915)-N(3))-methyltransferase RlmH, partial [Rikenellaceae bacterium]|nr:23S rRNA (pseudouridine(1915)-N(3))-methyltransferase RlmH [Rikenellaceae bacterium]
MLITLLQVGKTDTAHIREAVEIYFKRINHYLKFDIATLPDPRNAAKLTHEQRK